MTIALTTLARIRGTLTGSGDGGTATLPISEGLSKEVAHGTGIDAANNIYIDEFSIAASGTLSIDLSGSLTNRLGEAAVFTKVKEILLIADSTNTNDVIYGNDAASFVGPFDELTTTVTLKPGNSFHATNYSAAGWTVTATTGDIIKLANSSSGTAVTGTIVIVGLA